MENDKEDLKIELANLEEFMISPNFWDDKTVAQETIKKIGELKDKIEGINKYDKGGAIFSILAGAGGDDAEDFSLILLKMYLKYFEKMGWNYNFMHENKNDFGGYRNITLEIIGKGVYGNLKNESGVHRLVRISPFNANAKRHTSFCLVEIVPKLEKGDDVVKLSPDDIKIEFSKSGGPGGQNVNKRETAVRIVHIPTNISVHVTTERSQEQNKDKALEMLKGKLFKKQEEDRKKEEVGLSISKNTEIEWGNQIRSYVFHPYKQIKDHRTGIEIHDIDKVLEDGFLDEFIEAEKDL
jgi:peptide chain release factor 2